MDRRLFLERAGLGALGAMLPGGAAAQVLGAAPPVVVDPVVGLVPIRATPDRIFRTTVCLRPFRAAGPRIEAIEVGRKRVVTHYGHGGSGWSLSWGSAPIAVAMAMEGSPKEIAVIGAGAIGLTTAITAQRARAKVTIYAKERFPDVRSARATGTWSPDSRIAKADAVGPDFAARWESMARASFARHQAYLGMAGDPVEWSDRFGLFDLPPDPSGRNHPEGAKLGFVDYQSRIRDLTPRSQLMPAGTHPFRVPFVRRNTSLTFNVADLSHQLETDFLLAGGRFVPMEFNEAADLARLKEKVVIACTGYGSRALFRDESIVPVRGQIAWLIPQAGAQYGLYYRNISVLARRDGIVIQDGGVDDTQGYNDDNEQPDRAAAETSVQTIASLYQLPAAG